MINPIITVRNPDELRCSGKNTVSGEGADGHEGELRQNLLRTLRGGHLQGGDEEEAVAERTEVEVPRRLTAHEAQDEVVVGGARQVLRRASPSAILTGA